ncbi:leukotriene-A4 hydrolase [Malassezia vespertilionis]|uniref:leukotriene-A4 hydrolase n=1 Tax=Malassezia vespertilionis TaxID=2020962 RepID=UPI0024B0915A|nr:leukotriene-A4 hydrolase [Malassezia vespertilionis]WFD06128.1 leukotriene-A4 hydrolase [Malassezia vespertilionis]
MRTENAQWAPPAPDAIPAPRQGKIQDIHSLANLNEICPRHLHLDWHVDWDMKRIYGTVTHKLQIVQDGAAHATFDTSFLDIGKVKVDGKETEHVVLSERRNILGEPLTIALGPRAKGDTVTVDITYSTTEKCTSLGWLSKEQTHGKETPFLYSQNQAIHGRSLLPVMDAPGRKVTYTAHVSSKIPILMSALQDGDTEQGMDENKVYKFKQPVPIPSYLIAIVGGSLAFRSLGPRTGVWAESPDVDAAQWEFERDAERFLDQAEKLVSPYSWTRYDSVVLPPSFPYGGMENANLTTLTPTLVAGDRSLTDVMLHELCHSWSGNLTSCINWESFWLNEGWTVYLERLLLQKVHADDNGPAHRGFSYIIGAKALKDALEGFSNVPRFQRLIPEYKAGEDPDDAFSSIPYEKGSNFLLHLERVVGGLDVFIPYVRAYFHAFYNRGVSTEQWKEHLFAFYASNPTITAKLKQVDWDAWLYGEGTTLPVKMIYNDELARSAFSLAERWARAIEKGNVEPGFSADDMQGWNANQKVVFLESLQGRKPATKALLEALDATYGLSDARNAEIRCRFFELALHTKDSGYEQCAADWVACQGRMKFCRTIYKALYKVAPALARKTFEEHADFYHPIAAAMIRKDLAPSPAVVSVLGSTGTGKSQLGVELAQLVGDAEIISVDSMQTYKGLDVITNKAAPAEMQGIPHHLLSFLAPCEEYDITQFVQDATQLCTKMQSKGTLPILVGGTTYYLQHLLFRGRLVSAANELDRDGAEVLEKAVAQLPLDQQALWSALDAPLPNADSPAQGMVLWELLNALDPSSARRWHHNDARKVYRSLRILRDTGRPQSAWLAQQDSAPDVTPPRFGERRLFFWVWSDRETLTKRLDGRIGGMVERGLLDEIRALRTIAGAPDYTRGIFQAIGYKEFDAYLTEYDTHQTHNETLFQEAIQAMQVATRRYAKRQVSWIKNQLLPEIRCAQARGEDVYLYVLDASDPAQWHEHVRRKAEAITHAFLQGAPMPDPSSVCARASDLLQSDARAQGKMERNQMFTCDVCTSDPAHPFRVRETERAKHTASRTHRTACKRRTRQAWIAENKAQGASIRRARAEQRETEE